MTYTVDSLLNPRAFVYASNAEALVLQSKTNQTRLTFINSRASSNTLSPQFALFSSNEDFSLSKDSNIIATFNIDKGIPQFQLPGRITTNKVEFPVNSLSKKSIVLRDFNEYSLHQFAGVGYSGGQVQYQVTTAAEAHVFYAGQDSLSSMELMRVQTNGNGATQVGIGTHTLPSSNTALAVAGDTSIQGSLTVTGSLNFDRTGIVQLTSNQRIPTQFLPNNLLYLNSSNQLDPSYFPQEYKFQYFKAQKSVGIGTKKPLQRFHVNGSSFFSERIGIGTGTHIPAATIHAAEKFAVIPTLRLENDMGGNFIEAYRNGSNVFTLYNSPTGTGVGLGIGTTVVNAGNVLQIVGNGEMVGRLSASNVNVYDTLSTNKFVLEDSNSAITYITQQDLVNTNNIAQKTMMCYLPFNFNNGIATPEIRNLGSVPYVSFKDCSVRVDGDFILGNQMFVLSDARVKNDIKIIDDPLSRVDKLHGYTYVLPNGQRQAGVMAQEVLDVLPEAVTLLPEDRYAVSYDSLVPLLLEAVRKLSDEVRSLKTTAV